MLSKPIILDPVSDASRRRQEREAEEQLMEIRLLRDKYVIILYYTFLLRDQLIKFSSEGWSNALKRYLILCTRSPVKG
jgi:hypothetical protein